MSYIFNGLTNFFGMKLDELARRLHYPEDIILVLTGEETKLRSMYPDTYENIVSCTHKSDRRHPMIYARDLVASWLFEDFIVEKAHRLGYNMYLSGRDKERRILSSEFVGTDCDAILEHDGKSYNIEIVNDYTGYWSYTRTLDLRDSKFLKLKSTKSVLLAVEMLTKSYALIPVNDSQNVLYISSHAPYGNKPAYRIDLSSVKFKPFNVANVLSDLIGGVSTNDVRG